MEKNGLIFFSAYNSGTYNNQYMIVNYNLFTPGKDLQDNLLWIVEQIPGYVESADMTTQLARGYWPSYNVPYFIRIYNMSGYPDVVKKHGYDFSYELSPRAKIFRRDQYSASNMGSVQDILRYNNYKNDPFTKGVASDSICARSDLDRSPDPSGCIDTKVTSYAMQSTLKCNAIGAPTTLGGLAPFSWDKFNKIFHEGLPQVYNFTWVTMEPMWNN